MNIKSKAALLMFLAGGLITVSSCSGSMGGDGNIDAGADASLDADIEANADGDADADDDADAEADGDVEPPIPLEVSRRKFPYPYRAMLAISSDIDGATAQAEREYLRFLNTYEVTVNGPGLGLDFADSFWMFDATNGSAVSYWQGTDSTTEADAEAIRRYIAAGWIDTIHTYGNFSSVGGFTRLYAEQAIEEWQRQGIELKVWVHHGDANNVQNFSGGQHEYMHGDMPGDPAYHTDLLLDYGVEFAWGYPENRNEFGHDSMIYPLTLLDGQTVWAFPRYISRAPDWHPTGLHLELSTDNLDGLVSAEQYSIVVNHLGFQAEQLPAEAIAALQGLRGYQDRGEILVTRTSRLLEYNRSTEHLSYQAERRGTDVDIRISSVEDIVFGTFVPGLDQVRGVTFYADDPASTRVFLGESELDPGELQCNPTDGTGPSIGIRWFAPDFTDHSR